MKYNKLSFYSRNFQNIFLITLLFLTVVSCSKNIVFLTSSVVPAAEGKVKVKKDNNNNYQIQVDIKNLAEVSRLQPPKTAYVVWMETQENVVTNMGQLKSSNTFILNKLNASLEAISASKPTKIYITAENNPSTQYPDNLIILSTDNF